MDETPMGPPDARLEISLADLGTHLSYPPTPDLAGSVRAHLDQHPRRWRTFQTRIARRAVVLPTLAALAALASVLVLSPDARSAVASWFHLTGVQIQSGSSPPGPLGHNLNLGKHVSLTDAQTRVRFHILLPTFPAIGKPDAVYVGLPPSQGSVSLVYRARRGMPPASTTGVALLILEFQRRYFDAKMLSSPPSVVTIGKGFGIWLTGPPHVVYYLGDHGKLLRDTIRLAGDVLIWQRGTVTLRLEGKLSMQRAISIAQSMSPGS